MVNMVVGDGGDEDDRICKQTEMSSSDNAIENTENTDTIIEVRGGW
jgi:hypothetical protein